MNTLACAALLLAASTPALAGELWSGPGRVYDRDRNLLGDYTVAVTVGDADPVDGTPVDVLVRDASGAVLYADHCIQRRTADHAWRKECTHGASAGYMFDYGLGMDYYESADGTAFATQIVSDGPSRMRLSRTELRSGEATRFYVETLTLAPAAVAQ